MASIRPSGLKATVTLEARHSDPAGTIGAPSCRREVVSQSRAVPSSLPVAMIVPRGLNASVLMERVCPVSVPRPVRAAAASMRKRASGVGAIRHAATARERGDGRVADDLALRGQLPGDRQAPLAIGLVRRVECGAGRDEGEDRQQREAGHDETAATTGPPCRTARRRDEALDGGAGRREAVRVAVPAGPGVPDGQQPGAPVEEGGVARVSGPLCGVVDEPVVHRLRGQVGLEPLPEGRPGGQEHIMSDLDGVLVQGDQALLGERGEQHLDPCPAVRRVRGRGGVDLADGRRAPRRPPTVISVIRRKSLNAVLRSCGESRARTSSAVRRTESRTRPDSS